MGEKTTGYTLLVIGFSIIIASLYLVFNVFSGASEPYKLLNLNEISIDASIFIPAESLNPDVDHNIVLVDKESLNHIVNTIFYLIFIRERYERVKKCPGKDKVSQTDYR